MAVAKTTNNTELASDKLILIRFICPVCKTEKELPINKSVINQAKQLTTLSIPKNKVCLHHFQAFIDKNFKVRGYQKVDFVFELDDVEEQKFPIYTIKLNDEELLNNLKLDKNHLEYNPKSEKNHKKKTPAQIKNNYQNKNKEIPKVKNVKFEKKEMTLEEIYEQFWEFIDETNQEFRELILKDSRRGNKG
ncbi:MAG: hypothetical protein EU532_06055 [Promethearchaeota archaeon]|nr:MAG: hypothetical protein EU532_06055 [Candidatus Lokiarchaeota archaeon]